MNFDEKSILSTMNPILVIMGFLIALLIGYFSARGYRDTNDLKKSLKCSMALFVVAGVVMLFIHIPFFLIVGFGICTFIFTLIFSDYYFYH